MSRLPVISESEEDGGEEDVEDERDTFHAEQGNGTDSPPVASSSIAPALFTPYPSLAVDKFLTDDNGAPLVIESTGDAPAIPLDTPSSSASSSWLGQMSSRVFSESTSTLSTAASRLARAPSRLLHGSAASVDSVASHLSPNLGQRTLKLSEFCDVIGQCASLERAKILSVECYKEWTNLSILHRALVFHIRREGRSDVWLRLDRLRSRQASKAEFLRRGGKTEANDLAHLAGTKSHLLRRSTAKPENRIEFGSPPNLGTFRFCLQIICEELLEYRLWPANCWFMCSLLQEHLFETGQGTLRRGSHIRLNLAPAIRLQVRNRVWHTVAPPPVQLITGDVVTSSPVVAVRWKTLDGGFDTRDFDGQALDSYLNDLAETLSDHRHVLLRDQSRDDARVSILIIVLAQRALALEFLLLQQHPALSLPRVVEFLTTVLSHLPLTDSLALVLPFSALVGGLSQNLPEENDDTAARRLLRIARACEPFDGIAARAYITKARAIASRHREAQSHWTSGQVLDGHTGMTTCVVFSPDGKHIASASFDTTIRRWDAPTGESIGDPLQGHTDWVRAVAFFPNGLQIVSGSFDKTLRRWDASSGEPIGAPMRGHTHTVVSVAYSPDGKFIVSGSGDKTIRRWDASTGEEVGKPLEGHTGWVRSVAFSFNGQRVVSGSDDKTIRLWDAVTGEAIGEPWKGHTEFVSSVAFSPDGRFVVSGSWDDSVRRWDALTGASVGAPMLGHTDDVKCVAVSPDGKQIASASNDRTIRIWDANTGKQIGEPLKGHTDPVRSVAFSPDGRQIVSSSDDCTVRIWDSLEDLDRWTQSG